VEHFANTDAWEDGAEVLRTIAEGRLDFLSLDCEGRSGGWAVLRGLDADALEECARDFSALEETRTALRAFRKARKEYEGPIRGDSDFEFGKEARLRELAEDLGLPDYLERLDALRDLRDHPEWNSESLESQSARATLGLSHFRYRDVPLPAPEDLEPETDAGDAWSFEELASLVSALEEWESFLRGAVSDYPRLVLWHCGGVYEREKAEAEEKEADRARVEAEEDERGALVSALLVRADALVDTLDSVREHLDEEDREALEAYWSARDALAEGVPQGTRVSLRRVGA